MHRGVPSQSIVLLHRGKNRLQESGLGQGTFDSARLVDDGPRDRPHLIPLGQVGKFRGFYCVPADEIALHGELMGQPHRGRAVGSCGRREHLEVDGLLDPGEGCAGLWGEIGAPP